MPRAAAIASWSPAPIRSWNCASFLELGYAGANNSLVISNGGQVFDSYSETGRQQSPAAATPCSLPARVRFGTTRPVAPLAVVGGNNKITVNKGGRLISCYASLGMLGFGQQQLGGGVRTAVHCGMTRRRLRWLHFGTNSSGNRLVVTNGGQMLGYYVYLGRMSTSDNNSALVTGSGFELVGQLLYLRRRTGPRQHIYRRQRSGHNGQILLHQLLGRQQQQRRVAHGHQLVLAKQLQRVRGFRRRGRQA